MLYFIIFLLLSFSIAFVDYCILRFNGKNEQELSDQLQIEYLEQYKKKRHKL